jgi:hypothetical protein
MGYYGAISEIGNLRNVIQTDDHPIQQNFKFGEAGCSCVWRAVQWGMSY